MKLDVKLIVAAFAVGALSVASPMALAGPGKHGHDDHGHHHDSGGHGHHGDDHESSHNHGAKNGGQFVYVESAHLGVEMVAESRALSFYVTDHGEPISLEGASFKAVVQDPAAGAKVLPLKAAGEALSANLDTPLTTGAKIVFSGKDGDGETVQARFVHK